MIQGTPEWHEKRRGIPTSSQFHRIVTSTAKVASTKVRRGYQYELLAERLNIHAQWEGNAATDHGHEYEPRAVSYYEMMRGLSCELVDFVPSMCGRYGCSPDARVGTDGGLEAKCKGSKKTIEMVLGGVVPTEHRVQVYGNMFVCGALWWDFIAYHEEITPLIARTTNDDPKYQAWVEVFTKEMESFCVELDEMETKLLT